MLPERCPATGSSAGVGIIAMCHAGDVLSARALLGQMAASLGELPIVQRAVATGSLCAGVIGVLVGLAVGLVTHPLTAWFAAFEVGFPAVLAGALIGLVVGLVLLARRARARRSGTHDPARPSLPPN